MSSVYFSFPLFMGLSGNGTSYFWGEFGKKHSEEQVVKC
jgi:hypothetical protein